MSSEPPQPTEPSTPTDQSSNEPSKPRGVNNPLLIRIAVIVIPLLVIVLAVYGSHHLHNSAFSPTPTPGATSIKSSVSPSPTISSIPLSINPVSPSAIPIGDGKLSTSPEVGYVDSCTTSFSSSGGATVDGPWINQTNKTWDSTTKLAVQGTVNWPNASYSNTISGSSRVITSNDLPTGHTSGTFPIAKTDPAYSYDKNPNTIEPQSINWTLPANPTAASTPACTNGGPIGILSDGVLLYNALDGEGRDAGAHEILDSYQGHPDQSGTYHHHAAPTFLLGTSSDKSTSTLIGYAADGYGIYVERDADGNLLTNANLDACHGRTSEVMWNGQMTDIYHYDATLEYPYTIGCFHGTPISTGAQMKM